MTPTRVIHHWYRTHGELEYYYEVYWPDGTITETHTWGRDWPEAEFAKR